MLQRNISEENECPALVFRVGPEIHAVYSPRDSLVEVSEEFGIVITRHLRDSFGTSGKPLRHGSNSGTIMAFCGLFHLLCQEGVGDSVKSSMISDPSSITLVWSCRSQPGERHRRADSR